jgi:CxxC motif-containing protein
MRTKEIICVVCPNGCQLRAEIKDDPVMEVVNLDGNLCEKGLEWAKQELVNPMRTISSSILVEGSDCDLVSVRTDAPIPLNRIFDVMNVIKAIKIKAPVRIGDLLIQAPAGTSCNIIATRNISSACS